MVIKLRSIRRGEHVHEGVFVGPDRDHLAFAGTLILRIGEWQLFEAALSLGAARTQGHLTVILEGSDAVVTQDPHYESLMQRGVHAEQCERMMQRDGYSNDHDQS